MCFENVVLECRVHFVTCVGPMLHSWRKVENKKILAKFGGRRCVVGIYRIKGKWGRHRCCIYFKSARLPSTFESYTTVKVFEHSLPSFHLFRQFLSAIFPSWYSWLLATCGSSELCFFACHVYSLTTFCKDTTSIRLVLKLMFCIIQTANQILRLWTCDCTYCLIEYCTLVWIVGGSRSCPVYYGAHYCMLRNIDQQFGWRASNGTGMTSFWLLMRACVFVLKFFWTALETREPTYILFSAKTHVSYNSDFCHWFFVFVSGNKWCFSCIHLQGKKLGCMWDKLIILG